MINEKIISALKSWTWCRVDIQQYHSDRDTAHCFYHKGVFIVVVNPTNNLREWFENVLFFFNKKGKFGFIAYSYRNAGEDLYPLIKAEYDGKSRILFPGASRGAAIEEYLYCCFEDDFPSLKDEGGLSILYHIKSFGKPPTGKEEATTYYKSIGMRHTRFVNQNDSVPFIPGWGKQYESELVELKNNYKKETPWWRFFTLRKKAHEGYGTQLQELLNEKF